MGTEDQPDQAGEPKSGDDELAELERIAEEIERANAGRTPEEPMAKPAVLPDAPRQPVAPARTERPSGPAESYAWIRDWEQLEAGFCLLVTDRPDPVEVLGLLVPDPATPLMSSLEAPTWAKRMIDSGAAAMLTILEAKPVAAGTLVFEGWGGYTASVDGVPQRLSEHGHAAAVVQLTSNLDMSFKWAQDGEVIRRFDPFLYEAGSFGAVLAEEADLEFGQSAAQAVASSFALIERLTGARITQDLIEAQADTLCLGIPW